MDLVLYRGITAGQSAAPIIIENIRCKGLLGNENLQQPFMPDIVEVRGKIESIFSSRAPSRDDIYSEKEYSGVYACGDEYGARFYALKKNVTTERRVSILIVFKANIDSVYVDCRDFLCSAFQFWDQDNRGIKEKQLATLRSLYGDRIERYFNKCTSTSDIMIRIAMCNLAAFDEQITKDHYRNTLIIAGRYETFFCSAFCVKAPIRASAIQRCEIIEGAFKIPQCFIDLKRFKTLDC